MGHSIKELYERTVHLVERIDSVEHTEWSGLVKLRQKVIRQVRQLAQLSDEEKQLLRKIGEFDPVILKAMQGLKNDASKNLQKIVVAKRQKRAYQSSFTPGSFFFDKKK